MSFSYYIKHKPRNLSMQPKFWHFLPILLIIANAQQHPRSIGNEVTGEPKIECEPDKITVNIQTEKIFVGNMYVRGHFLAPECRTSFQNNRDPGAYLSVNLDKCGMSRTEQSNPTGVNYNLEVVVSFHPFFETRQDMAYAVNCFYKNEQISVNSNMDVKENEEFLRNPSESQINGVVENKCDYTIRVESVGGPLAKFTEIGQPVVHRWACEDKNMAILVKDCFAQSESSFSTQVIDNRGCPLYAIFDELTYDDQLTMAFVRMETFKFPDMNTIRFECNISFCNKVQQNCIGITPPNCPKVRPSEYIPNSNIDSSVDPTRVYAPIDYRVPISRSPLFQTTRKSFPFHQITAATRSPFVFSSMGRFKDYVKNEGPEFVEVLPAKQTPVILPISSESVAEAFRNSTDSPNLLLLLKKNKSPVFRPMSNERNVRARRAEDMSVKADTLFVQESLDSFSSSTDSPRKRHIISQLNEDSGVCLDRMKSTALVLALAILSSFSLATSIYILYDVCSTRHRRSKAQITARGDVLAGNGYGCSIKSFNSTNLK